MSEGLTKLLASRKVAGQEGNLKPWTSNPGRELSLANLCKNEPSAIGRRVGASAMLISRSESESHRPSADFIKFGILA